MMYQPINFNNKFGKFSDCWVPRVVAELNDYQFKLVKILGEFVWHKHPETDEAFVILDGKMAIDFRDGRIEMSAGEMFVVPKGIEHKPVALNECRIMLIEPRGVPNTGNVGGTLTADNDLWV